MDAILIETATNNSPVSVAAAPPQISANVSQASKRIPRSQELRNRAAQTLSLFGMVLIISVLIAIPGQAYRTFGAELVVLAAIGGTGLHVLDRRAKGESSDQAIGPVLEAVTPITVTSLLLLAAGIVLVLGVHAGLYVLVGPVFVALAGGVTSAWLFLTKITE